MIRSRTVNRIHKLASQGKSIQDIAITLGIAGTLNARPKPIAIRMKQKTRYGVVVSVRHMLRNPAAPISESTIVGIYLEPVRKLSTRLAISSAAVSSAK